MFENAYFDSLILDKPIGKEKFRIFVSYSEKMNEFYALFLTKMLMKLYERTLFFPNVVKS